MRWTLLIALIGLVACKGGDVVDDTVSIDDTSTDDTNTDDTQAEVGMITVEMEFPSKPEAGPLIIGLASTTNVFASIVSTESFEAPTFPQKQIQTIEVAPGDYYIGAWIDEGSDNPERPGATDPKGVVLEAGPTLVTVAAGETATPTTIKIRRPAEPE